VKIIVTALAIGLLMPGCAEAEIATFQCTGFPVNPWALRGDSVEIDVSGARVKSLDTHYQWITATISDDSVQWVSNGATGDGTPITYIFGMGRANLRLIQAVSVNGRAVYTGSAQCEKVPTPQNQF
jgi:hypothetical protein